MDVDLLRPGTVPMSRDTMLWFEFLLNPQLLEKHLSNPNGDPTGADLIMKLLMMSTNETKSGVDPDLVPKPSTSLRSQALKIVALKVFAFFKWDLDMLEDKLPLNMQWMLLKDLLLLVTEELSDPSCHSNLDMTVLPPQVFFSVMLYHRWVIRAYVRHANTSKLTKINPPLGGEGEGGHPAPTEAESEASSTLLQKIASLKTLPALLVPAYESLVPLTEDVTSVQHRWDLGDFVSPAQFRCQMLMEVGVYAMLREWYVVGRSVISSCKEEYHAGGFIPGSYCKVTREALVGLCSALGLAPPPPAPPVPSLTLRFLSAVPTLDVGRLLRKDNQVREIPMLYRDSFELDVESEVASGKVTAQWDALQTIQAANLLRRVIEGSPWHKTKLQPPAINRAIMNVEGSLSDSEKDRVRLFLVELLSTNDMGFVRELVDNDCCQYLLTEEQILAAQHSDYSDPLPSVLLDADIPVPKNGSVLLAGIERQIVSSYDAHEIKTAVIRLWQVDPSIVIEKINRNWEVPIPLYNVLMALPSGVTQNYMYVLLCKAYQLDLIKCYGRAVSLLNVVLEEVSREFGNQPKLARLINWEIVLVRIHQFHNDWPATEMDWGELGEWCRCVIEFDGELLPRVTLREDCCLTLLNMGHWLQLTSAPNNKLLPHTSRLYLTVASVCLDVKFNRKPSLDLWDKVLSVVNGKNRGDGLVQMQESLCRIMDVTALTVVASLLAKLHNILTEQPLSDLYLHLTQLWPNTLKNPPLYNLKWVVEMLWELANHAVQLYPTNMAWSKLLGDLHFASGHHASALKCYLEAAIAGSDYFARPVTRTILEDHFVKKMIRSCIHLQCHAQAGVLCQMLEEVDYCTAFKSLQEAATWDAMDSYYDCIWDITILEFLISLHTKRNEHYRKQRAILMMGLLELNSNNNDEIKREAENIRKTKFLRAMAKQYIC